MRVKNKNKTTHQKYEKSERRGGYFSMYPIYLVEVQQFVSKCFLFSFSVRNTKTQTYISYTVKSGFGGERKKFFWQMEKLLEHLQHGRQMIFRIFQSK